MLANDRRLMGRWVNKRATNVDRRSRSSRSSALCGAAYGIDSFLQSIHLIGS